MKNVGVHLKLFLPAAKRLGHAELRVEKKGTYGFLDMLTSVLVVFGIFLQYVEIFLDIFEIFWIFFNFFQIFVFFWKIFRFFEIF